MSKPESIESNIDGETSAADLSSQTHTDPLNQQGPGCMPAVLASAALMGIVGFITCALLTWVIFQKRTELAIRTLQGSFRPQIEQSLLDPLTKQDVIEEVDTLVEKMQSGRYEEWQAGEIMQNLQKLPILQWGELQALEQWITETSDLTLDEKQSALMEIKRLRYAVKEGKAQYLDFEQVMEPIREPSSSGSTGPILKSPITRDAALEAVKRAKLISDRAEIEASSHEEVSIRQIMRDEIKAGEQAPD